MGEVNGGRQDGKKTGLANISGEEPFWPANLIAGNAKTLLGMYVDPGRCYSCYS